jgi:hypothetical protein
MLIHYGKGATGGEEAKRRDGLSVDRGLLTVAVAVNVNVNASC